jgi:hypothetical protein
MAKYKNIQLAESLLMGLGALLHSEMRHLQAESKEGQLCQRSFAKLNALAGHVTQYARASRDLAQAETIGQYTDEELDAALNMSLGTMRKHGVLPRMKDDHDHDN